MTEESKLQEYLNKPLYNGFSSDWRFVPRYQHIERMGHAEVEGILNGPVIVQTKFDGANFNVFTDDKAGLIIASRNNIKSVNGSKGDLFNGGIEYVLNHPGICELAKSYILRGEWAVKHTIRYAKESYGHFYVFDVQEYGTERYLTPEEYEPLLEKHGIKYIKSIKVENPTIEILGELALGPDEFGAEQKEGIVIKRYDFINSFGNTKWGKIVSADFREKAKLMFHATRKDSPEIQFVSNCITQDFVMKIIHKIKDEGELTIKMMPKILGISWYDAFTEELWSFVKDKRVQEFNFGLARKLCETKTREVALDYFNGIIKE